MGTPQNMSVLRRRLWQRAVTGGHTFWSGVQQGPPDAILGLNELFKADSNPLKVSLGVGAYRDDEGKPWVLDSVRQAEKLLLDQGCDHEYLPITGLPSFVDCATKLAFGEDCEPLNTGRIAASQVLSGTGGLRVAANFMQRFMPRGATIKIPTPTWANHKNCFADAGLQ